MRRPSPLFHFFDHRSTPIPEGVSLGGVSYRRIRVSDYRTEIFRNVFFPGAIVICDTTALQLQCREIADAIVEHNGPVILTPGVVIELLDLRNGNSPDQSRKGHCSPDQLDLLNRITDQTGVPKAPFVNPNGDPLHPARIGERYYVELLHMRKRARAEALANAALDRGVAALAGDEKAAVTNKLVQLSSRTALVGKTDRADRRADEEIVVAGVAAAAATGRNVVVVTRDHGVLDQFYKLISLLSDDLTANFLSELCSTHTAQRIPLAHFPHLHLMTDNANDSFAIPRPRYCQYLIERSASQPTVTVLNCQPPNIEGLAWQLPDRTFEFLQLKGRLGGRNSDRCCPLNWYIDLPQVHGVAAHLFAINDDVVFVSTDKRFRISNADRYRVLMDENPLFTDSGEVRRAGTPPGVPHRAK